MKEDGAGVWPGEENTSSGSPESPTERRKPACEGKRSCPLRWPPQDTRLENKGSWYHSTCTLGTGDNAKVPKPGTRRACLAWTGKLPARPKNRRTHSAAGSPPGIKNKKNGKEKRIESRGGATCSVKRGGMEGRTGKGPSLETKDVPAAAVAF